MNILYVLNSGKPGGVEQHVLDLTKGMRAKNHSVFIWCLDGQIVDWYKSAGASVTTKKISFEIDPFYISDLVKFIKENKIDVVHAHELKAGVNATIAAQLSDVKVRVTHIHTPMSEWKISGFFKNIQVRIETFFYAIFVNLFSSTEIALTRSRKNIKVKEGISARKITIIPNGINANNFTKNTDLRSEILTRYRLPNNALIIGNMGRMSPEKGHYVLIEAFAKVLQEYSGDRPLYLFLAGGGMLEDSLKSFIKELGIESNVIVTGIFDAAASQKFYSTFDFFVFPSLAEGFGLVLIEAMSNELPVISSDLDVLKEVGGDDVVYFKSQDANDLKTKILDMLRTDEIARKEIGLKLRNRVVANFSMELFIDNYLNLYKKLLDKS